MRRYERHVGVAALLSGFVFDALTLGRPDQLFGNIILSAYLLISASAILALALYGRRGNAAPFLLLALLQFCFGNLAGGLLVLYGQSGTFEGSSLFFLVFGAFVIGNEFLRTRYSLLSFHIGAWFFLLLAYAALILPILTHSLGDTIFLLSVALSIALVVLFLTLLYAVSPASFAGVRRQTALSLTAIALLFTGFYFGNVIPPVPLSLQQIGIFHSVVRTASGYEATFEKPDWYELFRLSDKTYTIADDSRAYCFSSVFVPAGITTLIAHRFERYDEETQAWFTASYVPFPVSGGRDAGFRGYSATTKLSPGTWRCSVETGRGALVGRSTFTVMTGTPVLQTDTF